MDHCASTLPGVEFQWDLAANWEFIYKKASLVQS